MSKESHARPHETPLSNDDMYNRIISSSFERISNSKELAVEFLKSAGIFDKDGHLAPDYKPRCGTPQDVPRIQGFHDL